MFNVLVYKLVISACHHVDKMFRKMTDDSKIKLVFKIHSRKLHIFTVDRMTIQNYQLDFSLLIGSFISIDLVTIGGTSLRQFDLFFAKNTNTLLQTWQKPLEYKVK